MGSRRAHWSIKVRLSALVGALFLLSGLVLLGINYLLIRANLPAAVSFLNSSDREGGNTTTILLAPLQNYRDAVLNTMLIQSAIALAVAAALAVLLGWLVARGVLKPVHEMTMTARKLGADSLDGRRLAIDGPRDELTELADTFDGMLDRLAGAFDSQRRFVANASHELRTPLAAQRMMVEVAMSKPRASADVRTLGEKLLVMNERSETLIEGLLVLASSDRGLQDRCPVRLDEVVRRVLATHQDQATHAGITVHADLSPRTVSGDAVLLERVITNLLQNAVRYNRPGGEVWVEVGDDPALRVRNTGPVVPEDAVPTLFEPFRRLGSARTGSDRGVGLGLSIVESVVKAHAGTVSARPGERGGLDVTVRLAPGTR